MKKSYFFAALFSFCTLMSFAQLVQLPNGNIEIYAPNAPTAGGEDITHFFLKTNRDYGIRVRKFTGSSQTWQYGIHSTNAVIAGRMNAAIYGSTSASNVNTGRAFGVIGGAGGSTNGYNYGILGTLWGDQYGAAVYGAGLTSDLGAYVAGRYGGYFEGNVRATGVVTATNFTTSSDVRIKQNIRNIGKDEFSALSGILKLNPVEYNLKQVYVEMISDADTSSIKAPLFEEDSEIFERKHFGLVAQEVREIYPELVYEDGSGYLSIDYIGLIPLLIESVRELNEKVQQLEDELVTIQIKNATAYSSAQIEGAAKLYQNNPNPFSESAQISYFIPENVSSAYLYIYDMQGQQLKQIQVSDRGESFEIISGSEFPAGMYLYALVVDGQEIDVKRMIITK